MHAKRKQVEVPPCTKLRVLHGHVTNASRDPDHDVCQALKVAYKRPHFSCNGVVLNYQISAGTYIYCFRL